MSAKLAGKVVTNFKKEIIQNTISLEFDLSGYAVTEAANFTFCFESPKTGLDLNIVPVGSVNYLAEGNSHLVDGAQSFLVVPEGKFIVEVFECEGTASLVLSNSFSDTRNDSADVIPWKRFGQNFII